MIKTNDMVKIIEKLPGIPEECIHKLGLVVKGPYEDSIVIQPRSTLVCLVCDVMIEGVIYTAIPASNLLRL